MFYSCLNSFADNYVLECAADSKCTLLSPVQEERGPRLLYPHFGFSYRAIKTQVVISFYDITNSQRNVVGSIDKSTSSENIWQVWALKLFFLNFVQKFDLPGEQILMTLYTILFLAANGLANRRGFFEDSNLSFTDDELTPSHFVRR